MAKRSIRKTVMWVLVLALVVLYALVRMDIAYQVGAAGRGDGASGEVSE